MKIEDLARICHEANRAYCLSLSDGSQVSWSDAQAWQKDSALLGVKFRLANPAAPASAQHESWLKEKREAGWVYGEKKDPLKKTHPCILPYEKLPAEQRLKDFLFISIVECFRNEVSKEAKP